MVAVAGTLVRCDFCQDQRPAAEVFEPYRGTARCRDVGACERRQIRAFDPSIPLDEDLPRPPATGAPAGAACGICGASGAGLYERISGQFACRDRDRCQRQSIEFQYLRSWSDSSPDRLISSAQMRQAISDAGPAQPVVRTARYLEAEAQGAGADLEYSIASAARRR